MNTSLKPMMYGMAIFFTFTATLLAQANNFPIGTYWVKTRTGGWVERIDHYDQVADCGINIVVGGNSGHTTQAVLDAAESNGLRIILDKTESTYIRDNKAYHYTYESDGYEPSDNRLAQIEAPILYDFDYEGTPIVDNDANLDRSNQRITILNSAPSTSGYILRNFQGNCYLEGDKDYFIAFRLKINGNIGAHIPVARLEVWNTDAGAQLGSQVIYGDDFADVGNLQYKPFEMNVHTQSASPPTLEEQVNKALPESPAIMVNYVHVDFRVYWYGDVTLYVDNIKSMNDNGRDLLNGSRDNGIITDAQTIHTSDDLGAPTISGFYFDEPFPQEMEPMSYMSDRLYQAAPPDNKTAIIEPTLNKKDTFHQYMRIGGATYHPDFMLVDIYPIDTTLIYPGDSGYNTYIQSRWDNALIPKLVDARYTADYDGIDFYYATQVHSWDTTHREPKPEEIRAMVNLGLAYGAKGIFYFLYTTHPQGIGLVDQNFVQNAKWYEVQAINEKLQLLADDYLPLEWQSAFTLGEDPVPEGSIVTQLISGEDIEVANFKHPGTNEDCFFLVNRRTDMEQTVTVALEANPNPRLIEDVLASTQSWNGDPNRVAYRTLESGETVMTITLQPGEGRLFRVSYGLTGTVESNSHWSGDVMVAGDLDVASSTLEIAQGTQIRFRPHTGLYVSSHWAVNGTANAPIIFSAYAPNAVPGSWDGLVFDSGHKLTMFHAQILDAQEGLTIRNTENSEGVHLFSITLANNYTGFVGEEAFHFTLGQCTIRDNTDFGIRLTHSRGLLIHNTIADNGISGVYLYQKSTPFLRYNTITGNGWHSSSDPRYSGIYATVGSDAIIRGVTEGEAHNCHASNWISGNAVSGVIADGESFPILGVYTDPDFQYTYSLGGYNRIYDNPIDVANYNQSGTPLYAEVNYWGFNVRDGCERFFPEHLHGNVEWSPVAPLLEPIPAQRELLRTATLSELQGEYQTAMVQYDSVFVLDPNAQVVMAALGGAVRCRAAVGQSAAAVVQYLATLRAQYPGSLTAKFATDQQLPLFIQQSQYVQAATTVDTLLAWFAGSARVPIYLYERARIQAAQAGSHSSGLGKQASRETLAHLAATYPQSSVALLAQSQLHTAPAPAAAVTLPAEVPLRNYPNPFNPRTTIVFALPEPAASVRISIYNVRGQQVQRFSARPYRAGTHTVFWDGRNISGASVSSGVYYCVVATPQERYIHKLLLLR